MDDLHRPTDGTTRTRILLVGGHEFCCGQAAPALASVGYAWEAAPSGRDALGRLANGFDLLLIDTVLPDMEAAEFVGCVRALEQCRDTPIILASSPEDREPRLRAIQAGASDFLGKPVDRTELEIRVSSLLKMKEAQDTLRRYQTELEQTILRRTSDLVQALQEIAEERQRTYEAQLDTIQRLAMAAEHRDEHTAGHIHRVSHYCGLIGWALDLTAEEVEVLRRASPLHDVGKIGVPDSILLKEGRLTQAERAVMQQHTTIGAHILGDASSELLRAGELIAHTHHEKWDGTGYPNGLAGEDIPLYGRICAVADVFDALTSERPYKEAFSLEQARDIMMQGRGTHFEPRILDLFMENFDVVIAIWQQYREHPQEDDILTLLAA